MLQIVQYQKTGEILVEELPAPLCPKNGILVRTAYSLISAGTEKVSVGNAQSSLIQRAKKQPDQVKLVMDYVKKEGIVSTYQRVKSKLDSYKMLGYSASGVVVETDCDEFNVGDRVACAGAGYANHAEYIAVPKNLSVKIPDSVKFEEAAFTTLGSIALQGVRQADVRLGENVAVIGLGLLGQISIQLLKASGCRVAGFDINNELFDRAKNYGCDITLLSNSDSIKQALSFTRGLGFDSVIITASTKSNQPLELALQLARKKSKIVVVGAVGMNVPRSPFYEKELDLKISCSYGPGRYDSNYEELGYDYPYAYVRWTENRNMQAFLDMIDSKKIDLESMISHTYDINNATKAYDIITGKISEKFIGILIKYSAFNVQEDNIKHTIQVKYDKNKGKINLAFLGAGTFAQTYLIPFIKKTSANLVAVSTSKSANAVSVAKKFGFALSSTDSIELINHKDVDTIFCATQHDSHSEYVIESIKAGKPVFVEKPLAINRVQLEKIDKVMLENQGRLMLGFNRRFSKPFADISNFFKERSAPMSILYRVNAGFIPKNHWSQQEGQGGRIIGEVCHFVDTMLYLTNALPVSVYAESLSIDDLSAKTRDNISVILKFSDGSIGTLLYLANGDKSLPKEYCEVFCEQSVAIMNNFISVEFFKNAKHSKKNYDGSKGHKEEVLATLEAIKTGNPMPIAYEQIKAVTQATFDIEDCLNKK